MFVNFDEIFKKTPETELKIPKALAEQLSSKLPDGLRYVIDEKTNNLVIASNGIKKITITGITLVPTDEQSELLGNKYKFEDLMELSYNSQKPIPVKLKNDKYININGEEISVEHMVYNPFDPYKIKLDSTFIYPSPLPPSFSLSIGCEKSCMELTVKRVPNNSINVMAFESDKSCCLFIKYYFDPTTNNFSITLRVILENATTVKEIIDSIEIYNAFVDGKGVLAGVPINAKLETDEINKYDSEILEFWTKVYTLEKKLGVTFIPPFVDMDFEDICNIEEIYQNIVNLNPIRKNRKINSITSKWEFSRDDAIEETLKKPVYFEFEGTSSFELFGQKIKLPCIIAIFSAVLSRCEKDDAKEEYTLFLENESDERHMYMSILRFLKKENLVEYKEKTQDRILLFRDAKKCQEYLIKQ